MSHAVEWKQSELVRRSVWVQGVHLAPLALLAAVIGGLAALLLGFELFYAERIYPGVSVWGIALDGLDRQQAAALLEKSLPYTQQPVLTLRDGAQVWQVRPTEVGARLDAAAVSDRAYRLGRSGDWIERLKLQAELWRAGRQLSPALVFDPAAAQAYLERLAASVNRPAQDAGVRLEGMQVFTTPSIMGRALDMPPLLAAMEVVIRDLRPAEIALPFQPVPPAILNADLPALEIRKLLASPLTLGELGASGQQTPTLTLAPELLAQLLVLRRQDAQILVQLDEDLLWSVLEPLTPTVTQPAVNGRYVFDDETSQFVVVSPSADGQTLDIPATLAQLSRQAFTDNRFVPLIVRPVKAAYHDAMTPQELGITQLVAQGVTYFKGSSAARIQNIRVAASKFHGIIVAPGETFSFNQYLGNVSPEEGYEEALIIYEGRTIRGVGGGVCQVSTTALRAAFSAGFPIVERWPHAYRVSWYEKGFGPGLDATVYAPLVDFKFTNDTPYHLLIETYVNDTAGALTYKFYSTSDGRKVTIAEPEISQVVAHGPDIYEEDASLAPGEIRQVDWAVDGADVTVRRVVERDGAVLLQDSIYTHYQPWQAVFKKAPDPTPPVEEQPQ